MAFVDILTAIRLQWNASSTFPRSERSQLLSIAYTAQHYAPHLQGMMP